MTFLSRRKRRTTAPRTRAVPRALSLAFVVAMAAGVAVAQQPARVPHPPPPTSLQRAAQPKSAAQPQRPATGGTVMQFHKPADAVVPAHLTLPPLSAGTGLPEIALPAPGFAVMQKDDKKDDKKNPAAQ